jgi:acyl carrier protein
MTERSTRYPLIEAEVIAVLKHLSGRDLSDADSSVTFFDLGFDSLLLTQASQSLRQKFGVKITFRQLLEDLLTIEAVSRYLDEQIPANKTFGAVLTASQAKPAAVPQPSPADAGAKFDPATGSAVDRIVKQQLELMARQLELLRSVGSDAAPVIARLRELGMGTSPAIKDAVHAEKLKAQNDGPATGPVIAPPEDVTMPLPEAQKGLWLLSHLHPDANRAYLLSVTLSFEGKLDEQALSDALCQLVERHGALRTTVNPNGQSQTIHALVLPELLFFDFSAIPGGQRDTAVAERMAELENRLFPDLHGPFFRTSLFRLEPERHLLLLTFHHLVANGPSFLMLTEELAALYAEKAYRMPADLPPAVPFSEFIGQRLSYAGTEASRQAEAFWMKQFETGVPDLELPFDHGHPPELTFLGARQKVVLDSALNAALRKIGAAHRSSLFMMLFAAYGVLLHRLSGQDDLVVGVPFDSLIRVEEEGRSLFANTTNMLPLRSILYDGSSFVEYLQQINALILEASEHQDYFFGNLMRKLNFTRDSSRSLFFNVTFNRERGEFKKTWPDLEMSVLTDNVPSGSPRGLAIFDLCLNAAERISGEIVVECDHNTALVEPETMERWLKGYKTLLEGIIANPDQSVSTLPLLTREELQDLVVTGQTTLTS